jgi:hypothetical protein
MRFEMQNGLTTDLFGKSWTAPVFQYDRQPRHLLTTKYHTLGDKIEIEAHSGLVKQRSRQRLQGKHCQYLARSVLENTGRTTEHW